MTTKQSKQSINQKAKSKFRRSSKWLKFRSYLKKTRKVDELTNKPLYKGWTLHHCDLDPKHYEDISDENKFCCLNKNSHDIIHAFARHKDWRDMIDRLYKILEKMEKINQF